MKLKWIAKLGSLGAIGLITLYQGLIRPHINGHCRFEPSCSHYAQAMFRQYGFILGCKLTLKRLAQCHPWGKLAE